MKMADAEWWKLRLAKSVSLHPVSQTVDNTFSTTHHYLTSFYTGTKLYCLITQVINNSPEIYTQQCPGWPGTVKFTHISRLFMALLPMLRLPTSCILCYYDATKHRCSPKMDKLTINSFPYKIFTRQFPDFRSVSWHFSDSFQILWHFQVFQTSALTMSQTRDLSIMSPMPHHCTTTPQT